MRFTLIAAQHPGDFGFWPNLGFGYIAAYLRKYLANKDLEISCGFAERTQSPPDLVGISSVSQNYNEAIRLARRAKERFGAPVIMGGVHITALPATLPAEAAAGVLGEGEETLRELVALYLEKRRFDPCDLARVRGIAYREAPDGPVKVTAPRPLIEPLDGIPHPDRDVLGYRGEDTYLFTSRGCPFSCRFCSSRVHWGKRLRCFSAEYVTEELTELWERYGTRRVHFYDDLFVADRKRLERMGDLWRKAPWRGTMQFSCAVRAELVDREMAQLLREMNFTRATFGAESDCPRILRYLKGESASPAANQRAVDLLAEAGIGVALSFIKGSPTETREELEATYRFITRNLRRRKFDGAEIGLLVPFPGTETWEAARATGLVSEKMDWGLLRRPWEGLLLNPEARKHAAWDFLYAAKIRELRDLGEWEVMGLVEGMSGPLTAEFVTRLLRVRNVTQWVFGEGPREGAPAGRLLFAPDAAARWAEPARRRIHLRVTLESLDRPDALDGLIWHLYENRLPALRWARGGRTLAEAIGPTLPARGERQEFAAYEPGDSPLDAPDGIPAEPSLEPVLQAAARQAVALADALQDRDNRLARAQRESGERAEWGLALSRELDEARARILSAQREAEDKGRWGAALDKEVGEAREHVLSAQREVEEKARWALALDKELREARERIISLQRDVEERGRWGLALDKELAQARERLSALQREMEEKNRWALALDEELKRWRSGQVRLESAGGEGEKETKAIG